MNNLTVEELKNTISSDQNILIQGIGFDQRCLEILRHLDISKFKNIIGIYNIHSQSLGIENMKKFNQISGDKGAIVGEGSSSMMELIDTFINTYNGIDDTSSNQYFVDITSMSHELLIALIGLFNEIKILDKINFLYTHADEYGEWLSHGVSKIRSVLGFSGIMYPTKKTHLVVLTGFEVERARDVIFTYEPALLSIGTGGKEQSISPSLHLKNEDATANLNNLINVSGLPLESIHSFNFSCTNPFELKQQLLEHIKKIDNGEFNIIIAPLNNKISTVGVALAALENNNLQVCYAEAKEYNSSNYVSSSGKVSIFSMVN